MMKTKAKPKKAKPKNTKFKKTKKTPQKADEKKVKEQTAAEKEAKEKQAKIREAEERRVKNIEERKAKKAQVKEYTAKIVSLLPQIDRAAAAKEAKEGGRVRGQDKWGFLLFRVDTKELFALWGHWMRPYSEMEKVLKGLKLGDYLLITYRNSRDWSWERVKGKAKGKKAGKKKKIKLEVEATAGKPRPKPKKKRSMLSRLVSKLTSKDKNAGKKRE